MKQMIAMAAALALLVPLAAQTPAEAGWRKGKAKSAYRGARVKGYTKRRGGYSYSASDVANTAGDSRTRYGSVNAYRDPFSDRQTNAGPFDHGWFFDSAVAPRGGDSPYMQ